MSLMTTYFQDLKVFAQQCQKSREEFASCEAFLRSCTFEKAAELTKNFKLRVSGWYFPITPHLWEIGFTQSDLILKKNSDRLKFEKR